MIKYILIIILTTISFWGCQEPELDTQYIPEIDIVLNVSNIKDTEFKVQGTILSEGNTETKNIGCVWSTNPEPTVNSSSTFTINRREITDVFTSQIKNLKPETVYYIRTFATNEYGTVYGSEQKITTQQQILVSFNSIKMKELLLNHGKTITSEKITIIDTDDDGEISVAEANVYNGRLNLNNAGLTDLSGLEHFTNAIILDISNNSIENSIDLSQMLALQFLLSRKNKITDIQLPKSTNLISIDIRDNLLEKIDLTDQRLNTLFISENELVEIDLTGQSKLNRLYIGNNKLKDIDITDLTSLEIFNCNNNMIQSINIGFANFIKEFSCHDNDIEEINLSSCKRLTKVFAKNNKLSILNISNSKNELLTSVITTNNPQLKCIKVDEDYEPQTGIFSIDDTTSLSSNCN